MFSVSPRTHTMSLKVSLVVFPFLRVSLGDTRHLSAVSKTSMFRPANFALLWPRACPSGHLIDRELDFQCGAGTTFQANLSLIAFSVTTGRFSPAFDGKHVSYPYFTAFSVVALKSRAQSLR